MAHDYYLPSFSNNKSHLLNSLYFKWKVRTLSHTLNQAFKIKTLLDAIDFPSSYNGVAIRERLEHTLDEHNIIEEQYYKETIDEERVGKREWGRKFWSDLSIIINPPKETIEVNKQKFGHISDLIAKEKATELLLYEASSSEYTKLEVTPKLHANTHLSLESVGLLIEELKYSIRGAAAEIGISHSTLIRYVSNEVQRSNKSVLEKLDKWFKEHVENL